MNILVLLKMVPDVVEELEIAPGGKALDAGLLRMILSESDDHALEEALLLKERHGGRITAVALDASEMDNSLYAALAKGVDRAVSITGMGEGMTTRAAAHAFADVISTSPRLMQADLILTGSQAIDDLDGLVAPLVAHQMGIPYVSIVTRVMMEAGGKAVTVRKEYPVGMRGEFEVPLPAVFGIQSAEKPPRYVPVAKVRAVMKSQRIENVPAPEVGDALSLVEVLEMGKPVVAGRAEMIEGSLEEIAGKVSEILVARGVL